MNPGFFRIMVLISLSCGTLLTAVDKVNRVPDWSKVHVPLGGSYVPVTTYFTHVACIKSLTTLDGAAAYAHRFLTYLYPKSNPFQSVDEFQAFLNRLDKLVYARLAQVGKERRALGTDSARSAEALEWEYSFLEKLFDEYEAFQSEFLRRVSTFGTLNDESLRWEKTYLDLYGTSELSELAGVIFQLHHRLGVYDEIRDRIARTSEQTAAVPPLAFLPSPLRRAIEQKLKLTEERRHSEPIWKAYEHFLAKAEEIAAWRQEGLFAVGDDLAEVQLEIAKLEKEKAELAAALPKLLLFNGTQKPQYVAIEVRPMRGPNRTTNSTEALRDALVEMYHQLARKKGWNFRKVDNSFVILWGPKAFDYLAGEGETHA
ncbi:MAG: PCRF domain-containing protein [Bdellovibrionota bacterium]